MSDCVLVRDLRKRIGKTTILDGINMTLPSKGFVGVLGPSGCGKTSLLNVLSGIDGKFNGSVVAVGRSVKGLDEDQMADFRLREIGYITQGAQLLDLETALANVVMPLEALYGDPRKSLERKAKDWLRFVGLEKKANRRVNTLSGGERQRVALARALANNPKIVLADEPTGALDEKSAEAVFSLLKRVSLTRLVIVVSHDGDSVLRYADDVFRMKDGKIVDEIKLENPCDKVPPSAMRLDYPKKTPSLSEPFLLHHARSVMKGRKLRNALCTSAISLGLIGLGLAVYIYGSISEQVANAMSGFVPGSCLVAEPNNAPSSPISNISAASMQEAKELALLDKSVLGYGVSLVTDYESVFGNENDFYLIREGRENYHLDGFSARSINDFLWIGEDTKVYPSVKENMAWSDVVLGLPYDYMFRLAFELGSMRDYESLGKFLETNNVSMFLYLSNFAAEFQNEDIFDVVGIVESDVPCLYHTDSLWNYHYFVDRLCFRPVQTTKLENMQQMFALPYLEHKGDLSPFVQSLRKKGGYERIVLEPFRPTHMPSLYDESRPIDVNRVYLYNADKYGVSAQNIRDLQAFCSDIKGIMPCSSEGYYASTSSVLLGFARRFYLTAAEETAHQIGETCSVMQKEDSDLPIQLPKGAISGELSSGTNGLRVVSGKTKFSSGNAPSGIREVCLSSSLFEKWGRPKEVFVASETSKEVIGETVIRSFSYARLSVVGVEKSDRDTIYVTSYWTYDFPLCELNVSGFALEPTGLVLCFDNDSLASSWLSKLADAFPSMGFFHPLREVRQTVDETTSYIGVVLIAFSLLALLVASILFLVVMSIIMEESQGELDMFFKIGFAKAERIKSMRMLVLNQTLTSFFPSVLILLALEVVVNYFIGNIFASSAGFPLSWPPFAAMALASFLFYLFLSTVIWLSLRKKRYW